MLVELNGNMFRDENTTDYLIIPTNQGGVMGCGLARYAKVRWGRQLEVDYAQHLKSRNRHDLFMFDAEPSGCTIVLFPTKEHWWDKKSNTVLIQDSLMRLVEHIHNSEPEPMQPVTIAMPPVGCGAGRLDYYDDVLPLIQRCVGDDNALNVRLYLPR